MLFTDKFLAIKLENPIIKHLHQKLGLTISKLNLFLSNIELLLDLYNSIYNYILSIYVP